jgi:hypothetical protein
MPIVTVEDLGRLQQGKGQAINGGQQCEPCRACLHPAATMGSQGGSQTAPTHNTQHIAITITSGANTHSPRPKQVALCLTT